MQRRRLDVDPIKRALVRDPGRDFANRRTEVEHRLDRHRGLLGQNPVIPGAFPFAMNCSRPKELR